MSAAIEVRGLRKRFGSRTALHGLDLSVAPGTICGLIGPNGAGKTTTLRVLLDIIRPSAGAVTVLGEDPTRGGPALRRRIGYVPGELRLDGRVTGRRMLDFYTRVSGPVSPGRIHELAERLGLDLNRRVRTLSKGNKQKLGLVQAFMHSPELLILDEPTSGLDPLVQREFLQLVREARDNGQTVLLSSHVLSEIQQTADEVAVLSDGRIVAQGDVASIRLGAVRRVHAALADATAEETREALGRLPAPTRLHDLVVTGSSGLVRVSATVDGEVDALVKALAQFRVVDLTVEEPDLEESVLRLYGAEPGRAGSTRSAVHSSRHTGTPSASDTADAPATRREGASRAGASDGPAPSEGAATSTHAPTPPRREDSSDRTSPPAPHAEPPRLRRDRTRRGLPPAPPVQHGDEEHSR